MSEDYDPLVIFNVVSEGKRPHTEEYVQLLAVGNVDLAGYALVDRDFSQGVTPISEFCRIFVFPAILLQTGDIVNLYTGVGRHTCIDLGYGRTLHKLHWGARHHVWNGRSGDQIALIKWTIECVQTV